MKKILQHSFFFFFLIFLTQKVLHERGFSKLKASRAKNAVCQIDYCDTQGQATADIVREFAENHEAWQTNFFNAWEKMQLNGYNSWELTEAPANGHLLSQTEW